MINPIPTEAHEGEALAKWLRSSGYIFTHIVNEGGLPYSVIGRVAQKWSLQGKSAGVPDYMIILKRGALLFIELKRPRKTLKNGTKGASPSKVSPEQEKWLSELVSISNVEAMLAYGWEEARDLIKKLEQL